MADMSNCPRNSVELSSHESVMSGEQTFAPLTLPKKSLTLTKSVAAVLAVCALLFIGVLGVAKLQFSNKANQYDNRYCNPQMDFKCDSDSDFYCCGTLLSAAQASHLEKRMHLSIQEICDAMTLHQMPWEGR